jgi:hypothetical protein
VNDELILLAVGSDGSVEQWDGVPAQRGILLRWFHRSDLGFPDYGYDLYRARVPDIPALAWEILAQWLADQTRYDHAGEVILESEAGFQFQGTPTGFALVIAPGDRVTLTFPDPAWYMSVEPAQFGTSFEVEVFAGGESKEVRQLASGGPREEWVTRGIERVELTGDGAVTWIRYGLLNAPRHWTHMTHLCLPVTDPGYPCGPQPTGTDEDEARSRVAAGVDWAARYSAGFADLHPHLKALATRTPTSFPPSTDPDAPDLGMDPASAVLVAALDPHIARMLGLAWDDDLRPNGLDGKEWSYKLVGRWKGARVLRPLDSLEALATLAEWGMMIRGDWQNLEPVDGAIRVHAGAEAAFRVDFAEPVDEVMLEVSTAPAIDWVAFDAAGDRIASGTLGARRDEREDHERVESSGEQLLMAAGTSALELSAADTFLLFALGFTAIPVERFTILPFVVAADPGPPKGPTSITARPEQPGGTASPLQAALTWDLDASPAGVYAENACVLYQVAARQLSTDPAATQPQPPPLKREYLLNDGRPILVPSEAAGAPKPPARYYTDQNLSEGWRAWWARGVDLFGRVSAPSPPDVERLEDSALPPPPFLLHTEYVQAALTSQQAALSGRSSIGRAWASAHAGKNSVAVSWGWTPELEALAPDVDGFRVYARRPVAVQNPAATSPQKTYDGVAWGAALEDLGAIPVRFDGAVTAVGSSIPNVTVAAVTPIGATTPADQWYCDTNLSLDAGTGTLVGARLQAGTKSWEIVGNGDGANVWIAVKPSAPTTGAPTPGTFEIQVGTSAIARIVTDLSPPTLGTDPFQRRLAGALVNQNHRLLVLGRSGGTFLCRTPEGATSLPSVNDDITWYPAYVVVLEDTGYGPVASTTEPVAHAQVTVTAVRRYAGKQRESGPAPPGTLTAVDTTPPPPPPPLPTIPTGDYCAEVATRADWYGVSRFALTWTATAGLGYLVYRALGDGIMQLDLAAHRQGTTVTAHSLPQSVWPPAMWNDSNRRQLAQQDLVALDAAIAGGNAVAIQAAYDALHADAQQLIAGQAAVEGAYVALNGVPLQASQSGQMSHIDEFDGRTRSHWFYRVAARSPAGLESPKTAPTPPICAPDVVPPAPPLAQLALADTGSVKLRWQRSPDLDVARYLVFRTDDETAAADVRSMQLVARVAPTPTSSLGANEVAPLAVSGEPLWLEHRNQAASGRDWLYRIVAEDGAHNRSPPSAILRGRSLLGPPAPPVWNTPQRGTNAVSLSWTHPTDQRLACLVTRRPAGGTTWIPVGEWLPRGVYTFADQPPDLAAGWEYRLAVRDRLGQTAASQPITTLSAAP